MQKIIIMGNLGSDPSFIDTKGGAKLLSFNVAVNRKNGENRLTTWYRVKTTNYSQNFAKVLKKGSSVIVTGDLTISTFLDKNGAERPDITIWADSMEFAMSAANSDARTTGTTRTAQVVASPQVETRQPKVSTTPPQEPEAAAQESTSPSDNSDDLPF